MRIKTEYIVLTVIIVAAAAYLVLRNQDGQHYALPELPAVKADDISKIVIERAGKAVTLAREGGKWLISPGGYKADTAKVQGMRSALADLKVTALVSESKAYARYDLGPDKGIHVAAFDGDRLLRRLDVGKSAPTFQHTFIKLPDDDRVYHGAGDFRRQFDQSADDLRDKVVMAVTPAKVTAITIETLTDSHQLTRKPAADGDKTNDAAGWVAADGRELAAGAVDPVLARLNNLNCSRFLDDRTPDALGTPTMTITLAGEASKTLQIYPELPGVVDGRPAVSTETAQPFVLAKWQVESLEEMVAAWRGEEKKPAPEGEAAPADVSTKPSAE